MHSLTANMGKILILSVYVLTENILNSNIIDIASNRMITSPILLNKTEVEVWISH
jgi:hypothetical protein